MRPLNIKGISFEMAQTMVDGAVQKASDIGVPQNIAIVDEGGNLKAFARMDGAPLLSRGIAEDKAFTSVSFGKTTEEWASTIKSDRDMDIGLHAYPRFVALGGGIPIKANGQVIGAIGVSGGHWKEDIQVAEAGIAAVKRTFGMAA